MKKIERGSKEHIIIFGISVALSGIVLFPLFDVIVCKFITKKIFTYSIKEYIIKPVIFGIFMGSFLYIAENGIKHKK